MRRTIGETRDEQFDTFLASACSIVVSMRSWMSLFVWHSGSSVKNGLEFARQPYEGIGLHKSAYNGI